MEKLLGDSLEGSRGGCYLILKLKPAVSSKPRYKGIMGEDGIINWLSALFLCNPHSNSSVVGPVEERVAGKSGAGRRLVQCSKRNSWAVVLRSVPKCLPSVCLTHR